MGDLFDKKVTYHPNFGPAGGWGGPDTWGGKAHSVATALDPELGAGGKIGVGSLGNSYDPINSMMGGLFGSDLYSNLRGVEKTQSGSGNSGGFIGGDYKASTTAGSKSGALGYGGGLGYSTWDGKSATGGDYHGISGGAGIVKNQKSAWDIMGFGQDTNLNTYRGVGGSGYTFNEPDRVDKDGTKIAGKSGVGLDASYTPAGLANSSTTLTAGNLGSAKASVGNAYLDKQSVSGQAGRSTDGTYFAEGNYSKRQGVDNAAVDVKTGIGTANASVGHASFGSGYSGGGTYNPQTGSFEVHGAQLGEGLKVQDANAKFDLGNGALAGKAHMGQWDTTGNNNLSAGWDAKRQVAFAKGEYGWGGGGTLTDASAEIGTKDKSLYAGGSVGKVVTGGYSAKGGIEYDAKTGQLTATGSGRGGGVQVEDAKLNYGVKGLGSFDGSLGKFSNDTIVDDVKYTSGGGKESLSVGKIDGMGMRFDNGKFESKNDLLGLDTKASFGSISSTNSIEGANLNLDYSSLKNLSASGGFKNLSVGGWSGSNIDASVDGPLGTSAKAHLGSFNQGFTGQGGHFDISKNGLNLGLEKGRFDEFTMSDANASVALGNLYKANAHVGEGSFQHFSAENVAAGINGDKGLYAGLENGQYRYLSGKDISYDTSALGGLMKSSGKLGEGSIGGVDIGKLEYNSTLRNANLTATDVGASGVKLKDLELQQSIGKAGASAGAKELNALDLNVGKIDAHTKNFGTAGNAEIDKAKLDVLNVKDGHAGLSWDGKEVLGASGSYRAGLGLDKATGSYDLLAGKAEGQFKNASSSAQLSDAKVNLFGHNLAVPDMGYKVNASGGGSIDAAHGAANANLSLAGSSVNFAGHNVTLGDWAQASGGVNMSQGAANFNLGGQHGLGANMNLAQGQLDVNLFGHNVDVAGGVRTAANAVSNTVSEGAHAVVNGVSNAAHAVGNTVSEGAHAVSNVAHKAWDIATSW